ncbi:MAG: Fic family protein, partial [bacterium]|nr:Fic family protein [bacterium]
MSYQNRRGRFLFYSSKNKQLSENKDINPVIAAGIVHQEIAAIHPFSDGNGRTARALATLILYQRGY